MSDGAANKHSFPAIPERSEWEHPIKVRALPADPVHLTAGEDERAALAHRFGIPAIASLQAEIALHPDENHPEAIIGTGTVRANFTQNCAITSEAFAQKIAEPVAIRFIADRLPEFAEDEEVELAQDQFDEIAYQGEMIDLGEAVAQSLALAIDPFATGPNAQRARAEAGLDEQNPGGPFAALAALKED